MTQNGKHGRDPVILSGARTPIGKFLGGLSNLSAADLGKTAVRAAVERAGINAADVSEIILGNVVSAGVGQAPPRQVSIGAGVPESVGGITVNKVCGSGLKAVMIASNAIKAEDGDLYIAGGTEAMSRAPYLDDTHRKGNKYGHVQLKDSLQTDGLWCALCDWGMGNAAEFIGRQLEVTRASMDELRRSLAGLRAPGLGERKLGEALQTLCVDVGQRTHLEIRCDADEHVNSLPLAHAETLWRVAQEALTNVERHAQARHVTVTLKIETHTALLTIQDDGRGLPPNAENQSGHFGLRGMRERVEGLGGTLTLTNNNGSNLRVSLPLF